VGNTSHIFVRTSPNLLCPEFFLLKHMIKAKSAPLIMYFPHTLKPSHGPECIVSLLRTTILCFDVFGKDTISAGKFKEISSLMRRAMMAVSAFLTQREPALQAPREKPRTKSVPSSILITYLHGTEVRNMLAPLANLAQAGPAIVQEFRRCGR